MISAARLRRLFAHAPDAETCNQAGRASQRMRHELESLGEEPAGDHAHENGNAQQSKDEVISAGNPGAGVLHLGQAKVSVNLRPCGLGLGARCLGLAGCHAVDRRFQEVGNLAGAIACIDCGRIAPLVRHESPPDSVPGSVATGMQSQWATLEFGWKLAAYAVSLMKR